MIPNPEKKLIEFLKELKPTLDKHGIIAQSMKSQEYMDTQGLPEATPKILKWFK